MKVSLGKRLRNTLQAGVTVCALTAVSFSMTAPQASAHGDPDGQYVARTRPGSLELVSSIKVPDSVVNKAVAAARAAYAASLAPYAKVSLDEAKTAAMKQLPGATLHDIGLQAMRQNLVYIAMMEKDQMRHLVVIDAGTGKVLATRELPTHHPNMRRALSW
ncbi:MAG: PepSY domain-containing protein [Firmicutes bacterium]|nr:PepSY domain-containing protein [Bacillota bacterium]